MPGKRLKPQEDIIRNVLQQIPDLQEVSTAAECDVILVFTIIVSRTGTDIDAAVNELNALPVPGNVMHVVATQNVITAHKIIIFHYY